MTFDQTDTASLIVRLKSLSREVPWKGSVRVVFPLINLWSRHTINHTLAAASATSLVSLFSYALQRDHSTAGPTLPMASRIFFTAQNLINHVFYNLAPFWMLISNIGSFSGLWEYINYFERCYNVWQKSISREATRPKFNELIPGMLSDVC